MTRAERAASRIRTVDGARAIARRRLPDVVFDYIDGAADGERTMRENREAFEQVSFVPQMAVPGRAAAPRLATSVLGEDVALPVLLAPVGFTRAMSPGGDVAGAAAARAAGTCFVMSSMSGHTMEAVRAAAGTAWFQLYTLGGRDGARRLAARAGELGFTALVVTVDTPIPGNRERDARHGMSLPLRLTRQTAVRFAPDALVHPGWLFDFARDGFTMDLALVDAASPAGTPMSVDEAVLRWVTEPFSFDDLPALKEAFGGGPVLVKGVLSARDARRALDAGATSIVVSNHGGRQLDTVAPALRSLVEVVDEVGGEAEVLVDGGVRRGSDVAKALCLGARAVLIGRPWAFGLAAGGEAGVAKVLALLRQDLDRTMRLLGVDDVADLSRDHVVVPESWGHKA